MSVSARDALQRLQAGNRRFVDGISAGNVDLHAQRSALVAGQHPFAVILGCADSRVPAEIVFDQGLGDLFVIRVAGNIVAPSQVGSVEFAIERFGCSLVVVLGHSHCGAIEAALEELERPEASRAPNLWAITDWIRPAIETLHEMRANHSHDELLHHAVRSNIRVSAHHLRHGSRMIEEREARGELAVVGAHYALETGVVEFFDGVPQVAAGR